MRVYKLFVTFIHVISKHLIENYSFTSFYYLVRFGMLHVAVKISIGNVKASLMRYMTWRDTLTL